ncbi:hypothetical protein AAZV13_08G223500 [Glycine max]
MCFNFLVVYMVPLLLSLLYNSCGNSGLTTSLTKWRFDA